MTGKVLFAGFGDIAMRAATELDGLELYGLRRRADWQVAGVAAIVADVTRPETLSVLGTMAFDCVVVSLVPSGPGEAAYRGVYVDGLRNLLAALAGQSPPRVIFASSTSVYPQEDGSWVDESMAAPGTGFAGRVMLEAEALLQRWAGPALCLRFGGIYGPGRDYLLRQVRAGARVAPTPVAYTNRIHSDDCGRAIAWFVRGGAAADFGHEAINVVDSCPAPLFEVVDWLRRRLGVAGPAADAPLMQRRAGSKRVSNARLLRTGFRLLYPDFRTGYAGLLGEP